MQLDDVIIGKARTQWQFGDWKYLAELSVDESSACEQSVLHELEIYRTVALIQSGFVEDTLEIRKSILSSQAKGKWREALWSSLHNTLGRANVLVENYDIAKNHFRESVELGCLNVDIDLLSRARMAEQQGQMGITSLWEYDKSQPSTLLNQHILSHLEDILTDEPGVLIALAEQAQSAEKYVKAIRYWQQLASMLEEKMPQVYYDRLAEAYRKQRSFPLGSRDEEHVTGSGDKHQLLKEIHKAVKPRLYLEIGVQTGKSLVLAECSAIGVDPMPQLKFNLGENVKLVRSTSDEFFFKHANEFLKQPPDLAFIDGMHLFEYALRDFINIERHSSSNTLVVIDDIYPNHPAQAERDRRTRAWTGDVWKLHAILTDYRPDLVLRTLDAYPTGLMMIGGLNPSSEVLERSYDELVSKYKPINYVPDEYLTRSDAWSCEDVRVGKFLKCFYSMRDSQRIDLPECLHLV